ncbi:MULTISPECIES: DEAD/DEAH box helicase [Aeromonas]|uniref:DEAD/DEAH box helicase n=1 Tax=Aeromonas TaxID=642 RepID=UPI0015DC153D|nr:MULTISPECIES: ATP-binding domain-containing protein [Aeromonas]MBL0525372.1 DEAD/DEAH box helicase [Aeromonas dhakensis]MBL0569848.1 DEAD/DEAH box helicase [Aeromonas hydrophila]MCR3946142.1 ATP-binding domain-containing protein [Aeromonas caviae]MDX7783996.1 ATP-binding domain-containing protein [Aeromonas caviae]QXB54724.1 ATP-binding domain-containing protein [Aeromonas sp. FDAARGOS 1415]
MSDYCFYTHDALAIAERVNIKEQIDSFAEEHKKQTYVLCKPLSKEDASYEYNDALAIFSSGMKPCLINTGGDEKKFNYFVDDFLEDVSFLAEKFKYREKIGRKRDWEKYFQIVDLGDLDLDSYLADKVLARHVDLITSLIVGSINDVSRIKIETDNLLDSVKSKIILFDTDQTSFVFKTGPEKKFVIQGLAGSGKTELLLHKVKEIFAHDTDSRIAFTCFNKILAKTMKSRIPEFFDFMRVDRQIEWDSKFFCFQSWGSGKDPHSGMYRYICHFYNIPFGTYGSGSLDYHSQKAIEFLSKNGVHEKAFDYVFVDESQDFPASFLQLCELVTSKKVFIAGDVFQNIFRPIDEGVSTANMVLKKCYRTDPKNLMFSHALGMGLFEKPVLRWLKPEEWDACGYNYNDSDGRAHLTRDPLRRFEDIPSDYPSTSLHILEESADISDNIIAMIQSIRDRYPSVEQGDIAVIFIDTENYIYDEISKLRLKIKSQYNWESNVSFETKNRLTDKLFISNINNAKGLEFPFVICFAKQLRYYPSFRNALYTMMARSFLESHLLLSHDTDSAVFETISTGLEQLTASNELNVRVPTAEEIEKQKDLFVLAEGLSIEKTVKRYCESRKATPRLVAKIISTVSTMLEGIEDYSEEYLLTIVEAEYIRNRKL